MLSYRYAFLVGDDRRVRLWKDKWCGDELLCISFPLYLLKNSSKEAWMEEVWSHSSEEGCWAQCFSKHFNDWEMKSLECFLLRWHGRRVFKDREDEILWTESKDRAFFVKSLHRVLELGRRSVFPIRLFGICGRLRRKNLWIIFSFIILEQEFYGIFCSPFLVWCGCSPHRLERCC